MSSMECSYFPSEIIYEICSWAPNNTLGSCRVVSEELKQMTYDSKFIKLHSQRNNVAHGFFAPHLNKNKHDCSFASFGNETPELSLDFVPGFDVSLEAVSANHGIILCKSDNFRSYLIPRFFVCKPRIKLFQQIPNPRTKFWTEGVAISVIRSNPLRYKILRISSSKEIFVKNYRMLVCEVFDSETWMWKRLKDIMLPNRGMFIGWDPAVTVCGSFHWLINPNLVFSFDVEKEEWKTHGLPVKKDDYDSIKLVEYEGKLALNCMDSEGYMHTWVMESYKNQAWKKKLVINMKDPDSDHYTYTPMAFHGSDIIVVKKWWSLMYYDFKNGRVLKEVNLTKDIFWNRLFPFWSDSEPCCLRSTSESGVQRFEEEEEESKKGVCKTSSIHGVFWYLAGDCVKFLQRCFYRLFKSI